MFGINLFPVLKLGKTDGHGQHCYDLIIINWSFETNIYTSNIYVWSKNIICVIHSLKLYNIIVLYKYVIQAHIFDLVNNYCWYLWVKNIYGHWNATFYNLLFKTNI